MQTSYTFSISVDTLNSKVDLSSLEKEIFDSALDDTNPITTTLLGTQVNADDLIITFAAALEPGEVSKLNSIVASHAGDPIISPEIVSLDLPTTADGTLQTSKQQLELGRMAFKREDNQSERLNINGASSGVPTNIFNGTSPNDPLTDWTVSGIGDVKAIAGRRLGNGYDSELTVSLNQQIVFDSGLMQPVRTNFETLEFWIQYKTLALLGVIRVGWRDDNDNNVGTFLNIANYVSNQDLDEWKKVTIPTNDFGIRNNNVQKLVFRFVGAVGIRVWLDDISLISRAGGGPYTFRVAAPAGEIFHVERLVLTISAPDAGWSSTSFGNIADGLDNGLLFRYRFLDGYTMWSFNCRNNSEIFGQLSVLNSINFNDSELTIVFALEPELSSVVLVDDDEVLEIIVRDNLSTLTSMRAYLHYGVEKIPT